MRAGIHFSQFPAVQSNNARSSISPAQYTPSPCLLSVLPSTLSPCLLSVLLSTLSPCVDSAVQGGGGTEQGTGQAEAPRKLVWHVTPMTNTVCWFGMSRDTNDQHCQPVWHVRSHQWPTLSAVWACPPMTKQHLDSQKLNKYILLTHMNRYTSKYRCRPTHLQYTQLYIHRHYGGQRSNRPGSDHQNTCTLSSVTKRKSLKQINSTCNCLILVKVSPDFFLLMLLYLYSEGSATNFTWWLNVAHQPFTVTYQQLSVAC